MNQNFLTRINQRNFNTVNPPVKALIQKHFNFLQCLFQNLMKEELKCVRIYSLEQLCKMLLNHHFAFFFLRMCLSVISKNPLFVSFDFLGPRDSHFQEIRYVLCLLEQ